MVEMTEMIQRKCHEIQKRWLQKSISVKPRKPVDCENDHSPNGILTDEFLSEICESLLEATDRSERKNVKTAKAKETESKEAKDEKNILNDPMDILYCSEKDSEESSESSSGTKHSQNAMEILNHFTLKLNAVSKLLREARCNI